MNNTAENKAKDYSQTLYLPQTEFPMRAGLPKKEPEIQAYWQKINLYEKMRTHAQGRERFILHDGPPYANGHIHIGHALNKILKDVVSRSQQLIGKSSNYVPGWDCHGLPIEWKIEEENYRAKGKSKPDFSDADAIVAFRQECRAYATHWVHIQKEEFKRLGIVGDWDHPYLTMSYAAEAQIAREILKFADNGLLYHGSKPVMWSVVEQTALAEAEVEYEDYISDTIWAAFDLQDPPDALKDAQIVIWTTTPWTIPGNRAIAYHPKISYGLYEITQVLEGSHAHVGKSYLLADTLADDVFNKAKAKYRRLADVDPKVLATLNARHPLKALGYTFAVPLIAGDYVTEDAGTGFVHTAPGHGRDDFDNWMAHSRLLLERGIDPAIPYLIDADGFYTKEAPGFTGIGVINDKGNKGEANDAVIKALIAAGALLARGKLKHQYPHSWRSKKPIIYRNTPQWFVAMDQPVRDPQASYGNENLRQRALRAITQTQWVPASGENRIFSMIANRPDWVVSRQRAWGVPICIFLHKETQTILRDIEVDNAILAAFEQEGADAWFKVGAKERFLGPKYPSQLYEKIDDVLDVWFDSGSTHAFTLENSLQFPGLAHIKRRAEGGCDRVMYLEGSDQHRGWFHSSLLESAATRNRAPFDIVLTHGFVLDERGRKMSKSLGNVLAPQKIIQESGADILRLWVCASDYADDLRIGPEILKTFVETYRKWRNTLRWMLGTLTHYRENEAIVYDRMPMLERYILHRLCENDAQIRAAYASFDFKKIVALLNHFLINDLSAFYFDIRKDALYCDPPTSLQRQASLTVIDLIFKVVTLWLAPILVFTSEEAWQQRFGKEADSVHLQDMIDLPAQWLDPLLAEKWLKIRQIRRVVTGALEIERSEKRIGSSLEAAPVVHITDKALLASLEAIDLADVCITSAITIANDCGPDWAFALTEVAGVSVVPALAQGKKCARSWKISPEVGSDAEFPDVTPRDAKALREKAALARGESL